MKLSRSQKKRAKNQRIAIARGLDRRAKRINETAKFYADLFSKESNPNEGLFDNLGHCPICKQNYCFNFAGTLSFCWECRVRQACLKLNFPEDCQIPQDEVIIKECTFCRWSRLDAEREKEE